MAQQCEAHILDRLPFVQMSVKGPRCFWAPRPTGDYTLDCSIGVEYAEAALDLMRKGHGVGLLSDIVTDMIEHANLDRDFGLIIGMMSKFGLALERGTSNIVSLRKVA